MMQVYQMKSINASDRKRVRLRSRLAVGGRMSAAQVGIMVAATLLTLATMAANVRFGMSFGTTPFDKGIYCVASLSLDVLKVCLPIAIVRLWGRCRYMCACLVGLLATGCLAWSMLCAVGFALSTRTEVVAGRAVEANTRHGWEAKVARTEAQLAGLDRHRPVALIQAELNAPTVPTVIWRRTMRCTDMTRPESLAACSNVTGLRRELVAAEEAERLESALSQARKELATLAVVGSDADPQAGALARLLGVTELTARDGVALILSLLLELGSALGFAVASAIKGGNSPPSRPPNPPRRTRREISMLSPRTATARRSIECWVATRLERNPASAIPARSAYEDFCGWSHQHGVASCSETQFGRLFSARISAVGGSKQKRRDRTYYLGVGLRAQSP